MSALTSRERAVLGVEGRFWRHAGAKEDAIRVETGLTPTRYYQVLNGLRSSPAAWEHSPAAMSRTDRLVRPRRRQALTQE